MTKEKRLNLLGILILLLTTISWGSAFIVLKETIAVLPAIYVIAIRFLGSAFLLFIIFFKKIIRMPKSTFFHGALLGVILFGAYLSQTIGLKYTTPSRNSFLTCVYCILTPFLLWWMRKKKPKSYNVISAVMAIIGVALIMWSGISDLTSKYIVGDAITLLCSVFYSLQLIFIDDYRERDNTFCLLTVELFVTGVLTAVYSLIFELPKCGIEGYALNGEMVLKLLYLTVICTLLAQLGQIFGQKLTSAMEASLICSMESVFATLFSLLVGMESLSALLIIGFVVVFLALLISELKIDIFKVFKKKEKYDNK